MGLAARAVRGTMFVVAGQYASMLINFGATVILARLLSPTDFGIFALGTFFFTLIDITSKANLDYGLMHRQDVAGAALPTHFVLKVVCAAGSVFLAGALAVALPWFGYSPAVANVLLVLAVAGVVQAAGTTSWMMLEKDLRFGRTMSVTVTAIAFSSALSILLAWQGWGVRSLAAGVVSSAVLMTGGMWLVSPWRFWERLATSTGGAAGGRGPGAFWNIWKAIAFDGEIARWYLRFGSALIVGALATMVLLQFDNFLVGSLVGVAALGFYDRAYRLANLPTGLVTHVASRAALPVYAKVQGDRVRLSYAFGTTLELIAALSVPLAVLLFVAAPDVVTILLGDPWLPTVPILRVLLGYSVMRPFLDDTGALLTAIGRPKMQSLFVAAGAAALVAAATPLTLLFGVVGTAVGVNVGLATGIVVAYWAVGREVDVPYRRLLLPPMLGALAALGVWFVVMHAMDLNELPVAIRLTIKVIIAGGVYVGVVVALEGKRLRERTEYVLRLARGG